MTDNREVAGYIPQSREAEDANALIAEAAQHPDMDELLARDPRQLTKTDRLFMMQHFRQERAMVEIKEKAKADKKAEGGE